MVCRNMAKIKPFLIAGGVPLFFNNILPLTTLLLQILPPALLIDLIKFIYVEAVKQ
jgi:hypothetical protein